MKRTASASAFAALAASCTPALAHVAPWSSPDPSPPPVQFLIGIALMAVAGAVILWQGAALARGRERRRGLAEAGRHDGRLLLVQPHRERGEAERDGEGALLVTRGLDQLDGQGVRFGAESAHPGALRPQRAMAEADRGGGGGSATRIGAAPSAGTPSSAPSAAASSASATLSKPSAICRSNGKWPPCDLVVAPPRSRRGRGGPGQNGTRGTCPACPERPGCVVRPRIRQGRRARRCCGRAAATGGGERPLAGQRRRRARSGTNLEATGHVPDRRERVAQAEAVVRSPPPRPPSTSCCCRPQHDVGAQRAAPAE